MHHTQYAAAPWRASRQFRSAGRLGLLLLSLVVISLVAANQAPIPTISITAVKQDQEVTIRTANFPPNQTFNVTMGQMGTRGVNGTAVGTLESGAGGTLEASFVIPEALRGSRQISIRLETLQAADGSVPFYYSFNWFYNAPAVTTPAKPRPRATAQRSRLPRRAMPASPPSRSAASMWARA